MLDLRRPGVRAAAGQDLLLELSSRPRTSVGGLRQGIGPLRANLQGLQLRGAGHPPAPLTLATPWRVVLDGVSPAQGVAPLRHRGPVLPLTRSADRRPDPQAASVLDHRTDHRGRQTPWRSSARAEISKRLGLTLMPLTMAGHASRDCVFCRNSLHPAGAVDRHQRWILQSHHSSCPSVPCAAMVNGCRARSSTAGWSPGESQDYLAVRTPAPDAGIARSRWPALGAGFLNSGYVQRGLSRYTDAWGPRPTAPSAERNRRC